MILKEHKIYTTFVSYEILRIGLFLLLIYFQEARRYYVQDGKTISMKKATCKYLSDLNEGKMFQFSKSRLYDDTFLKSLITDIMEPDQFDMENYKMKFIKGNSFLFLFWLPQSNTTEMQ